MITPEEQKEVLENEYRIKEMNFKKVPNYELLDYVNRHRNVVSRNSQKYTEIIENLKED